MYVAVRSSVSCNTPFDLCLCLSPCFLNPHNSIRNTRIKLHVHCINIRVKSKLRVLERGRSLNLPFHL